MSTLRQYGSHSVPSESCACPLLWEDWCQWLTLLHCGRALGVLQVVHLLRDVYNHPSYHRLSYLISSVYHYSSKHNEGDSYQNREHDYNNCFDFSFARVLYYYHSLSHVMTIYLTKTNTERTDWSSVSKNNCRIAIISSYVYY